MKRIIFLVICVLFLTGCEQLPTVVKPIESEDYVTLRENKAAYELEQAKVVATSQAYSQTISLRKLESNNAATIENNHTWANTTTNFFLTVAMVIISAGVLIGLVLAYENRLNYQFSEHLQDRYHIQKMYELETKRQTKFTEIEANTDISKHLIDKNSKIWIALVNRLGEDEAYHAWKVADEDNKRWIVDKKQSFYLVDKNST